MKLQQQAVGNHSHGKLYLSLSEASVGVASLDAKTREVLPLTVYCQPQANDPTYYYNTDLLDPHLSGEAHPLVLAPVVLDGPHAVRRDAVRLPQGLVQVVQGGLRDVLHDHLDKQF